MNQKNVQITLTPEDLQKLRDVCETLCFYIDQDNEGDIGPVAQKTLVENVKTVIELIPELDDEELEKDFQATFDYAEIIEEAI